MNELLERRLAKSYKEYYFLYNKLNRPALEKQPAKEVDGLASWTETEVGLVDISNIDFSKFE